MSLSAFSFFDILGAINFHMACLSKHPKKRKHSEKVIVIGLVLYDLGITFKEKDYRFFFDLFPFLIKEKQ
jgi:hypothetical protein